MISEKDFSDQKKIALAERIAHVEKLLEGKEEPRPFELGLLLALKMAQEIQEKKPLGSESGDLVASWNGKYPESVVEEAIANAKEFMLNPSKLAEKIKATMIKAEQSRTNEAESADVAPDVDEPDAAKPANDAEDENGK
ncbi:MAG: hypothetical protein MJY78_09330 [Fibrobacter sp.]|nr:hypothetical protein [Fibrobacter sp.]